MPSFPSVQEVAGMTDIAASKAMSLPILKIVEREMRSKDENKMLFDNLDFAFSKRRFAGRIRTGVFRHS
jgi:hypothetical protein